MSVYNELLRECREAEAQLLVVSKTRTEKEIMELYRQGQRLFGENRAHELIIKANLLPSDIDWHLVGHLQTNKVKSVLPYVSCIQSLDSVKLWHKISQEAVDAGLTIRCLLEIKIAAEESKYGWRMEELETVLQEQGPAFFPNVIIEGVMGMATLTDNMDQVRNEFRLLRQHFERLRDKFFIDAPHFKTISMGMSGDYRIALDEGSTMIRVGSLLFETAK